MTKRILIKQRREIEFWLEHNIHPYDHPWALISIWGETELATLSNVEKLKSLGCLKVMSPRFHDITNENAYRIGNIYPDLILFDDRKARHIINFADEVKDEVETLVVHCAAGVSRSGAVGLFLCRYLGLDETQFRKDNPNISPNFFVLSMLNEESGINKDYVAYWEERVKRESELLNPENIF